jgi:hypothetical protein
MTCCQAIIRQARMSGRLPLAVDVSRTCPEMELTGTVSTAAVTGGELHHGRRAKTSKEEMRKEVGVGVPLFVAQLYLKHMKPGATGLQDRPPDRQATKE